jgi:hypothetical protein
MKTMEALADVSLCRSMHLNLHIGHSENTAVYGLESVCYERSDRIPGETIQTFAYVGRYVSMHLKLRKQRVSVELSNKARQYSHNAGSPPNPC